MVTVIIIALGILSAGGLITSFALKGMLEASKQKVSELNDAYEDANMINAALHAHVEEIESKANEMALEMSRRAEQRKASKKAFKKSPKMTATTTAIAEPAPKSKRKYTKKSN